MPNTENRPSYSDFDGQVKDLSLGDRFQLTKGMATYVLISLGNSILENFKVDTNIPIKDKLCFFCEKEPHVVTMIHPECSVYKVVKKKRASKKAAC